MNLQKEAESPYSPSLAIPGICVENWPSISTHTPELGSRSFMNLICFANHTFLDTQKAQHLRLVSPALLWGPRQRDRRGTDLPPPPSPHPPPPRVSPKEGVQEKCSLRQNPHFSDSWTNDRLEAHWEHVALGAGGGGEGGLAPGETGRQVVPPSTSTLQLSSAPWRRRAAHQELGICFEINYLGKKSPRQSCL
jgi:hypothetical protein